jgi:hypothetical protein
MPNYEPADPETHKLCAEVAAESHPVLVELGVTIGILFAHGKVDEAGNLKPALKHHGIPAAAVIRLVPLRDRMLGAPDAQLIIDGDRWPLRSVEGKRALADHELMHLEPQFDDDGKPKLDDAGRPKLKIRLHDFVVEGFDDVIARHGAHALEWQAVKQQIYDERGQALFAFLNVERAA